jgi:hypothetical protein
MRVEAVARPARIKMKMKLKDDWEVHPNSSSVEEKMI